MVIRETNLLVLSIPEETLDGTRFNFDGHNFDLHFYTILMNKYFSLAFCGNFRSNESFNLAIKRILVQYCSK